jgi:1-acyl-sn-glycerol-3-phosphate acyltransferase
MLEFSDAPYQFFPPRYSPLVTRLALPFNRHLTLPGPNHRIKELDIPPAPPWLKAARAGAARLLFVFNHPCHSDPYLASELHRRLHTRASFMAAYDLFLRRPLNAWVMQRLGHFSVDREGADRLAMATAIDVLKAGQFALNIFPEGNVYLTNDRLAPFLDGAAFIALKGQQALGTTPVWIIPTALKYTHLSHPHPTIDRHLHQLATATSFPLKPATSPLEQVVSLGRHLLAIHLRSHGHKAQLDHRDPDLYPQLQQVAASLVADLESELSLSPPPSASLIDRVRRIRSTIHQLRTGAANQPGPPTSLSQASRAILAFRILAYLSPYLLERPTIDRYAETVERLAEDHHSRPIPPFGPRRAIVHIGDPIPVPTFLDAAGGRPRNAVAPLTHAMEQAVQSGIDDINHSNDAPGTTLLPT